MSLDRLTKELLRPIFEAIYLDSQRHLGLKHGFCSVWGGWRLDSRPLRKPQPFCLRGQGRCVGQVEGEASPSALPLVCSGTAGFMLRGGVDRTSHSVRIGTQVTLQTRRCPVQIFITFCLKVSVKGSEAIHYLDHSDHILPKSLEK